MKFQHQSRVLTLLKIKEKYCSIIQIYILSISMHIQNLIEIHKLIHKILSINEILTSIMDQNSVKICQKQGALDTTWTLYFSMHIQNVIKIHPFFSEDIEKKTHFYISRGP